MTETEVNWVEHPPHYVSGSGVECINVIRTLPHGLATAMKYVWRYRDKWNPAEDLNKAMFYLNDYEQQLFKSKDIDGDMHRLTTIGAHMLMGTKTRSQLRTHVVWLESRELPEAVFFSRIYDYLQDARIGRVRYPEFKAIKEALEELIVNTPDESERPQDAEYATPFALLEAVQGTAK